jgi:hypothetical protein
MADVNLNITSNIESILNKVIEQQRAALQAKLRDDQRNNTEAEAISKRLSGSKETASTGPVSARVVPIKRLPFVPYSEELSARRRVKYGLILYWDGTQGVIVGKDKSTAALTDTGFVEGLLSTQLLGEDAITTTSEGFAFYRLQDPSGTAFDFGTGDFTVECFADPGNVNTDIVRFALRWKHSTGTGSTSRLELTAGFINEPSQAAGRTELERESTRYTEFRVESRTETGARHLCIQRSAGNFYLYVDGRQMPIDTTGGNASLEAVLPMPIQSNLSSGTFFATYIELFFASPNVFGQVRVTKGQALYPTTSFTPPSTAFFTPPS